ncbi:radical SAM protein [Candidatus Bathyarchaeota archaeon]|nr:radical SAM protein [Candidatus Bathyarchaeota archaeon]
MTGEQRETNGQGDATGNSPRDIMTLVYPYFKTPGSRTQMLFNPLGIALLAAILRNHGITVQVVDCTFKEFDEVIEEISAARPRIIGFYTMITMTRNVRRLAKVLRAMLPGTLFTCGGPLASVHPGIFKDTCDLIFRGEIGDWFAGFVSGWFQHEGDVTSFLESPAIDWDSLAGLVVFSPDGSMIVDNAPMHIPDTEFNHLPVPDRDDFDHESYQAFWLDKADCGNGDPATVTSIFMTAGCPFSCDFCSKPIFGNAVRFRTLQSILNEIRYIQSLGYNYLWISDDILTLDLNFLESFCMHLVEAERGMAGISWSCLSRATPLPTDLVALMKQAGCDKVYLGLESGNERILEIMNKRINLDEARTTVRLFKEHGIKVAGFFIVGYPGETKKTIEDTFIYASSLNLDEVSFNVPFPIPGSKLYERLQRASPVDMNEEWTIENQVHFIYDSDFSEDWLQARIERFYRDFDKDKLSKQTPLDAVH